MKRSLLSLIFVSFIFTNSYSQSIVSFTVSPANPTSADTIQVIIETMFTSGSCDGTANITGTSGDYIFAQAYHCVGMLTVICTDYDTINILPQAPGQYNFVYILNTGDGFPCIPGTLPMVMDSVYINVTGASGIDNFSSNNHFNVFPNPSKGKIFVHQDVAEKGLMKIYSTDGKLLQTYNITEKESEINTSVATGFYTLVIENRNQKYVTRLNIIE